MTSAPLAAADLYTGEVPVASQDEGASKDAMAATLKQVLVKVSGVPMLEAHMHATRSDYAEYARTTSVLIPWPPRH